MQSFQPKIIVILGPTAAGKTELGIRLAREFNGEVISADARQVYRRMPISTGRPSGQWEKIEENISAYVVGGVPHYFLDVVEPDVVMSVAEFKSQAAARLADIARRGKLPIVVGGTGLYISALIDNWEVPAVLPNSQLRRELESKSLLELSKLLGRLDPETNSWIDKNNRRRLVRALEVVIETGQSFTAQRRRGPRPYNDLRLGVRWPWPVLRARIEQRIDEQMAAGMVAEVEKLAAAGFDPKLPSLSSLGCTEILSYLQGECTRFEALRAIKIYTWRYAKRQLTWFKRDKNIHWIEGGHWEEAAKLVKEFL